MAFVKVNNYYPDLQKSEDIWVAANVSIGDGDKDFRGFNIGGVVYLVKASDHDAVASLEIVPKEAYRLIRILNEEEGIAQATQVKNKKTLELIAKALILYDKTEESEREAEIGAVKDARVYRGEYPYSESFD